MGGDKMGCKCGGHYVWDDRQLVCSLCGKASPYQPVDYGQLLAEHKRFSDKLAQIKDVIEGEGRPARKVADITEIVDEAQ